MKKSNLRKIIRESIKQFMTEQSQCYNTVKITPPREEQSLMEQPTKYHQWEVCSATNPSGPTNMGIGWQGMFTFALLGPTSGAGLFGPNGTINAFYGWVVSQVGPINVGDSFTFNMPTGGMCTSPWGSGVDSICFKYIGASATGPGVLWNGTSATATLDKCCDFTHSVGVGTGVGVGVGTTDKCKKCCCEPDEGGQFCTKGTEIFLTQSTSPCQCPPGMVDNLCDKNPKVK